MASESVSSTLSGLSSGSSTCVDTVIIERAKAEAAARVRAEVAEADEKRRAETKALKNELLVLKHSQQAMQRDMIRQQSEMTGQAHSSAMEQVNIVAKQKAVTQTSQKRKKVAAKGPNKKVCNQTLLCRVSLYSCYSLTTDCSII